MIKIDLAAHHQGIDEATAYVIGWCRQESIELYHEKRLSLIVEELIANTLEHGGPLHNSNMMLDLTRRGDRVTILYIDTGKPFDPNNDLDGDDRENALDDRGIGGLGWPLIKKLCESIEYVRRNKKNRTTLIRHISKL